MEWDCPGSFSLAPSLTMAEWWSYFLALRRTRWSPLPFERPDDFMDFSIEWSEEHIARLTRPLDT